MSEERVQLKGSRFGLELVIVPATPFATVRAELQEKLEAGSKLFRRGTIIQVAPGRFTKAEEDELHSLFARHGIMFRVEAVMHAPKFSASQTMPAAEAPVVGAPIAKEAPKLVTPTPAQNPTQPKPQKMLVLNRTVRGGQSIKTEGSVLICGNVNPGAEIVAGGSIDIRGTCRGTVHAGAYGDTSAFIIADVLTPVQIRIANRIARPSDEEEAKPRVAERASIKNGQIQIEPIER